MFKRFVWFERNNEGGDSKFGGLEQKNKISVRTALNDLKGEIGLEDEISSMNKIENEVALNGSEIEFKFKNAKIRCIKNGDLVQWKDENGKIVNKVIWLKILKEKNGFENEDIGVRGEEKMLKFGKERVYVNFVKGGKNTEAEPETIVYFHGNGSSIDKNLSWLRNEVERMRKNGRWVNLIIPENKNGKWMEFKKRNAFNKLINYSDSKIGRNDGRVILASHSGGYEAVNSVISSGQKSERISKLALFDSMYGNLNSAVAKFAGNGDKQVYSVFTKHLEQKNKDLMRVFGARASGESGENDKRWVAENGNMKFISTRFSHGETRKAYFEEFLG